MERKTRRGTRSDPEFFAASNKGLDEFNVLAPQRIYLILDSTSCGVLEDFELTSKWGCVTLAVVISRSRWKGTYLESVDSRSFSYDPCFDLA
jgi:hypothetical protein